jgi:hypothetical protein
MGWTALRPAPHDSGAGDEEAIKPSIRDVRFEDVSGIVELVCRPEFATVQGQVSTVDGGLTL